MAITVAPVLSPARRSLAAQIHSILRSRLALHLLPARSVGRINDMKSRHGTAGPLAAAYTCRVVGSLGLY